jgi:hypothetical protein
MMNSFLMDMLKYTSSWRNSCPSWFDTLRKCVVFEDDDCADGVDRNRSHVDRETIYIFFINVFMVSGPNQLKFLTSCTLSFSELRIVPKGNIAK